jgi:hypothetical protein
MSFAFATSVDNAVLTRSMRAAPPPCPLTRREIISIHLRHFCTLAVLLPHLFESPLHMLHVPWQIVDHNKLLMYVLDRLHRTIHIASA